MTDNCNLCEEALNNLPCTELLCHHKYHTECFLTNLATATQIHCVVCEQGVVPDIHPQQEQEEQEQEQVQPQEEEQLLQLYDTNEQFRNDLKKFMKVGEEISKPRKAFQALLTQKKRELNHLLAPHLAQAQEFYDTKKNEILESEASKNYKQLNGKWIRLWSKMKEAYPVNVYSLRALRSKPGMRRLHAPEYYDRRPLSYAIRYSLGYGLGRRMRR